MKHLLLVVVTLVFSASSFAVDDYVFECDQNGVIVKSIIGLKKAPEHPVVGLNIKVLKQQVPLYVVQASFDQTVKNLFVTDWTSPSVLSSEGEDLLSLLSLFYGIETSDVTSLRAGVPTDLLETFAYLELKHSDNSVTKLAFEGIEPTTCK